MKTSIKLITFLFMMLFLITTAQAEIWVVNSAHQVFRRNGNSWIHVPKVKATDVGVAANGTVWIIGEKNETYGHPIYRWMGNHFKQTKGQATRIDVGPKGFPWVVNNKGNIFRLDKYGNWKPLPGRAYDIGIGRNGTVWVVGANSVYGGYGIYRWNGNTWKNIPGGAVRIDVDPRGNAWVVNSLDEIFRWNGNKWIKLPGKAKDISVDQNGVAWVIGTDNVPGGHGIYRWNGSGWTRISGGAIAISAGGKSHFSPNPNPSTSNTSILAICGTWKWSNGETVKIFKNGRATSSRGNIGKWNFIWQNNRILYIINWNNGQYIDKLHLNGNRLDGNNQIGTHVWGTRH